MIAAGDIHTVTLALVDMQGRLKGKHHEARRFAANILDNGEHACAYLLATDVGMTPVDGYDLTSWDVGYGDLHLLPDPSAIYATPWRPGGALVIADALNLVGAPIDVSPRRILANQVERLALLGYSAQVGVEIEYVLYHSFDQEIGNDARSKHPRPITRRNGDYEITHHRLIDTHIGTLMSALVAAKIPVEAIKTEAAGGQVEATFAPTSPIAACDDYTVFKLAAKLLASDADLLATFMAAPEIGIGSGLHLHISLHRDDRPAFVTDDGGLNEVAGFATAGLLNGLRPLMPLLAPTVNSYRRFRPNTFAPTAWCWGWDNRTCAIRVTGDGSNRHLEIRAPGADANIYLALAAVIAGIVDGIDHEMAPPKSVSGSAYVDDGGAEQIAVGLADALAAFRASELPTRIFGKRVVDHYARAAEIELAAHSEQISESELRRGLVEA